MDPLNNHSDGVRASSGVSFMRGLGTLLAALGVLAGAMWLSRAPHASGPGLTGYGSQAMASMMQPAGGAGRPIYTARELADGEIAVLDAETVLAHWNAEIELCSRMVDQLASLANEDVSGKARLSPYPGMLSKALNARQDATLALSRAKGRFEAMKRINAEAMTLAPVGVPTAR